MSGRKARSRIHVESSEQGTDFRRVASIRLPGSEQLKLSTSPSSPSKEAVVGQKKKQAKRRSPIEEKEREERSFVVGGSPCRWLPIRESDSETFCCAQGQ